MLFVWELNLKIFCKRFLPHNLHIANIIHELIWHHNFSKVMQERPLKRFSELLRYISWCASSSSLSVTDSNSRIILANSGIAAWWRLTVCGSSWFPITPLSFFSQHMVCSVDWSIGMLEYRWLVSLSMKFPFTFSSLYKDGWRSLSKYTSRRNTGRLRRLRSHLSQPHGSIAQFLVLLDLFPDKEWNSLPVVALLAICHSKKSVRMVPQITSLILDRYNASSCISHTHDSSRLQALSMPPSNDALYQHFLRSCLQIYFKGYSKRNLLYGDGR